MRSAAPLLRTVLIAASTCVPMALVAGAARAEEFFAIRDENPLVRGFYLPLPSDSRRDAGPTFAADFSLSNTLNVESRGQESLFVDGESATLRLQFEDALGASWHYRLTLPIIRDSGGILDTVIDDYHQALGFQRGNRPYYPKNRIDYAYSGAANIAVNRAQTSIGDVDGEAGWYAVDTARSTVSLWGGFEAPSGKASRLTGDGAWDAAAWLHWALRGPVWQGGLEAGVTQPLGDEIFAGAAHRMSGFARASATRFLGAAWSVRVQVDGQTARVNDSELRLLGPSLQVALGATRQLSGRWRVQFGFVEDAAVNTAPDITFFLGIHD